MSAAWGKKRPSTFAPESFSISASRGRGYFDKSSFAPNWVGFRKMETYSGEHILRARSTNARCPACSAPIVGTKPITRCSRRAWRAFSFIHAVVRIVSMTCGSSGCVPLAVESNQVHAHGFGAKLSQHGGDLTAVIAPMIHDMLHHLPAGIASRAEAQRFVLHHLIKICLGDSAHVLQLKRVQVGPPRFQFCNLGKILCSGESRRRAPVQPFQPDPFHAV